MHVWCRQKKTKQAGQRGTCQQRPASITCLGNEASQPAAHSREPAHHSRAAETGWIQMHVWGRAKKNQQASQRGTCLHCGTATITHLINKGSQQAPHGGQQADHSLAAEIGGIQMHVWCWAKENKAGRSEGHMPA